MPVQALARSLRAFMKRAPESKRGVYLRLFGIRHAKDLDSIDLGTLMDLASEPDMGDHVNIEQGMELAEYVVTRP